MCTHIHVCGTHTWYIEGMYMTCIVVLITFLYILCVYTGEASCVVRDVCMYMYSMCMYLPLIKFVKF